MRRDPQAFVILQPGHFIEAIFVFRDFESGIDDEGMGPVHHDFCSGDEKDPFPGGIALQLFGEGNGQVIGDRQHVKILFGRPVDELDGGVLDVVTGIFSRVDVKIRF